MPPMSRAVCAESAESISESAWRGIAKHDSTSADWSIANPARYQAGPHEAVVGLSAAIRTVTIRAPTGCTVDVGDTWRVYNGYCSAEGTFSTK
jgi:hypothetical protein